MLWALGTRIHPTCAKSDGRLRCCRAMSATTKRAITAAGDHSSCTIVYFPRWEMGERSRPVYPPELRERILAAGSQLDATHIDRAFEVRIAITVTPLRTVRTGGHGRSV